MASAAKLSRVEVEWKLDPVAIVALILSLGAAISAVWFWALGSSVRLIPPDRVAIYSDEGADGTPFIRIAAHMSYANVAQAPYGDLVLRERVQLRVGKLVLPQQWNAFGSIDRQGINMMEPAGPQPLPGQSAISHFTLFAPPTVPCRSGNQQCDPKENYIRPESFVDQLAHEDDLLFKFEIELIDGDRVTASCHASLSPLSRRLLANVRSSYVYLLCYPA